MQNKVIIVGAGLSGATIAHQLAKKGYKVTIYDKRPTIAGNAYDFNDNNILVHLYGPHIFHTSSKEVFDFISQFDDFFKYEHRVLGHIDDKYVPIPFNLTSLERLFKKEDSDYIKNYLLTKYEMGKKVPVMELKNSDDQIIQQFGNFVYEKVFYHYTLKQWGKTPEELNPNVMNRVPVYISYEDRYFLDTYQYMPLHGFTKVVEKMLDHPNIKVILNTDFLSIAKINDDKIYLNNQLFDGEVIYTGCIDELFNYQLGKLPYRSLNFVFKTINQPSFQDAAVVNYPNEYQFTRISEFSKFTSKPTNKTIIVEEYPKEHTLKDIPYYPIEIEENINLYQKYLSLANKIPNLHLLGRLANYKYVNMDVAILNALKLSDKF
ncbi:MAG: UDP-galactopyranose mutase [Bacilli bacterium]|nr:UDP-galactopyranose mutase [Bacilli bacterium]